MRHDGEAAAGPTSRSQVAILLQGAAAGVGPENDDTAAGMRDGQLGKTGGLYHRNETPKAAREGIISTGHGGTGIGLADGAGDLVSAPETGSTATGYFIPVDGI